MKHRAELCELCVVKRAGCSAAKIRGHLEARSIYSVIRSKITVLYHLHNGLNRGIFEVSGGNCWLFLLPEV
jgi:hypothetical protein